MACARKSPLSCALLLFAVGWATCAEGRRSSAATQEGTLAEEPRVDETTRTSVKLSEFPELLKDAAGQRRCRGLLKKLGRQREAKAETLAKGPLKDIAREAVGCIAKMRHKTRLQADNIARDICLLTGVLGSKRPLDAIVDLGAEGPGAVLLGAMHLCECKSLYANATAQQLTRLIDNAAKVLSPPRVANLLGKMAHGADRSVVKATAKKMIGYISDNRAEVPSGLASILIARTLGRLGKDMPAKQVKPAFKELGLTILAESNATRVDSALLRADFTVRNAEVGGFEKAQRKAIAKHVLGLKSRVPIRRLNHLSGAVGFEVVLAECAERPKVLKLLPACGTTSAEDLKAWVKAARGALSTEELLSSLGRWATARRCRGYRAARELTQAWADTMEKHSKKRDLPSRVAKLASACSGQGGAAEK